jgi:hypothetical protein
MCLAEGEQDGMKLAGTFVEQVAEIGGRRVRCGDGEIHVGQLYREFYREAKPTVLLGRILERDKFVMGTCQAGTTAIQ